MDAVQLFYTTDHSLELEQNVLCPNWLLVLPMDFAPNRFCREPKCKTGKKAKQEKEEVNKKKCTSQIRNNRNAIGE